VAGKVVVLLAPVLVRVLLECAVVVEVVGVIRAVALGTLVVAAGKVKPQSNTQLLLAQPKL
jgi:hypothetical protein